jgi:hypothetical protein
MALVEGMLYGIANVTVPDLVQLSTIYDVHGPSEPMYQHLLEVLDELQSYIGPLRETTALYGSFREKDREAFQIALVGSKMPGCGTHPEHYRLKNISSAAGPDTILTEKEYEILSQILVCVRHPAKLPS